ncbi:hypothetical protein C8Q75DRAFT_749049 [Abortiporus biennis]|nr:hypothetical protein C8Q75DRAFT_749049 [Abortiporus biennis]
MYVNQYRDGRHRTLNLSVVSSVYDRHLSLSREKLRLVRVPCILRVMHYLLYSRVPRV